MRALSIRPTRKRVPGVEEILRGIKRIEYRSRPVSDRIIGQRFYIYAAMKFPSPRNVRKYCRLDWLPSALRLRLEESSRPKPAGLIQLTAGG